MNVRVSPALFALICLAFLLPFATVSCDGSETSFTGAQLVTWTVPAGGHIADPDCDADLSACVEDRGSAFAVVALGVALLGFALGVFRRAKGAGWCAAGGLSAMLAIAFQGVQPLGPTVNFHIGYWLILLLFFVVICLHAAQSVRRRGQAKLEEHAAL